MDVTDDMQSQAKALADPSRFRLFRHIAEASGPVGVAELTELLGFNHNAIRQHLTVLRDAGLVAETDEDRKVRGRPRKQYVAREDALSAFGAVSGSYEQLARLLLEVATTADSPYEVGRRSVALTPDPADSSDAAVSRLHRQLSVSGFEPSAEDARTIVLQHCPLANVATDRPDVVCDLHRGIIDGLLGGGDDLVGNLEPKAPHAAGCRITIAQRDA